MSISSKFSDTHDFVFVGLFRGNRDVLRVPYGVPGMEPGLAACKGNTLTTVLFIQATFLVLNDCNHFEEYLQGCPGKLIC